MRYLQKNGVLKIFERVNRPGQFSGSWSDPRVTCSTLLKDLKYSADHLKANYNLSVVPYPWTILPLHRLDYRAHHEPQTLYYAFQVFSSLKR